MVRASKIECFKRGVHSHEITLLWNAADPPPDLNDLIIFMTLKEFDNFKVSRSPQEIASE